MLWTSITYACGSPWALKLVESVLITLEVGFDSNVRKNPVLQCLQPRCAMKE